jgi:hypothetical protein
VATFPTTHLAYSIYVGRAEAETSLPAPRLSSVVRQTGSALGVVIEHGNKRFEFM